jgi:hypothetical protein
VEIAEGLEQKFEMMETRHQMMGETLAVKLRLDIFDREDHFLLQIHVLRFEVMEEGIILLQPTVMMGTIQMVTDAVVPALLKLDTAEAEGRIQTQTFDPLCEVIAKELALKDEMMEALLLAMDEMLAVRLKLAGHAQEDHLLHKIHVLKYAGME